MIVGEGTFGEIVDYDEGIAVVAAA